MYQHFGTGAAQFSKHCAYRHTQFELRIHVWSTSMKCCPTPKPKNTRECLSCLWFPLCLSSGFQFSIGRVSFVEFQWVLHEAGLAVMRSFFSDATSPVDVLLQQMLWNECSNLSWFLLANKAYTFESVDRVLFFIFFEKKNIFVFYWR